MLLKGTNTCGWKKVSKLIYQEPPCNRLIQHTVIFQVIVMFYLKLCNRLWVLCQRLRTDFVLKSNKSALFLLLDFLKVTSCSIYATKPFLFNASHSHALRAQRANSFSREQQHEGP